jgi:hypothetical protein
MTGGRCFIGIGDRGLVDEKHLSQSGRTLQDTKTTSDINSAATAPGTYRWPEEKAQENASTTTSPSTADTRNDRRKTQHSNRLAGDFENERGVYRFKRKDSYSSLSNR